MALNDGEHRAAADFLTGGGEMGALMRAHDWSTSPLGPPESWPQSLRSVAGLLLGSKFPMFVAWGPELGLLYNDAYQEILGAKHPAALGGRFEDIWREIWPDISPLIDAAMAGEATYSEDLPLVMNRRGYEEQTWFTFSYSPVRDESGAVAGMFCACTETTGKALAELQSAAEIDRLAQMFRQAPGAVALVRGPSHVFEIVNPAYERLVGRSDLVGRTAAEALPEVVGQGFIDLLDSVYRSGKPYVGRSVPVVLQRRRNAEAEERVLDFVFQPLSDASGSISGIFVQATDVTESARSEAALRASEARTRAIVEATPECVKIVGCDGSLLYMNNAGLGMIEADGFEGVCRANVLDIIAPEDREQWRENNARVCAGERLTWEFDLIGLHGTRRRMETHAVPILGPDGTNQQLAVTRDVTDRAAAEKALRESEARLRALTDHLPGGMVYQIAVDADGNKRRFLYVSQSHQELTGITAEAVLADPSLPYQLIDPEDRPRLAEAEAEAIRTQANFDVQARFRRADGELRWCRIISAPRQQADGSTIWDGIQIDITNQKRIEAALRESAAQLSGALTVAKLGTFDWDLRTDEVTLDERSREIFEFGAEEGVQVEELFDRIDPADFERVRAEMRRSEQQLSRLETEYRLRLPDGTLRTVISFSEAVAGAEGEAERISGVFADITDRKRLEEDLRSLNETLEKRVEERTAELMQTQEALRQSQKLEAMGQLTGGVAHDFNNLLSPIVGSLDLLQRRGVGTEREQRLVEGALQSAERATTLVQRLLAFARRQPLQPRPVDVGDLVSGMADLVASTSGPQVKLVLDIPDDLPAATADPNQLEMAILNLSVNARDAMPDGGRLTISASAESVGSSHRVKVRPGSYVRLSVADTGTGMDEATLARAIEPFFSTKGIGKGTGLGLSMVHGLASQLGGALAITSRAGLGTNVELWLPVSDRPAEIAGDHPQSVPGQQPAGAALLVDDEDLVRESTADMLGELGYEVTEASSAEQALALLEGGARVDLLVTDHLMPGMTGADLARLVREQRPGMPVLIISGYAQFEGTASDLPRLAKPFRQADLAAKVAELAAS